MLQSMGSQRLTEQQNQNIKQGGYKTAREGQREMGWIVVFYHNIEKIVLET